MSETRTRTAKPDGSPDAGAPRRRAGFPAPITILTLVLVLVWLLTFFIPSGQYQLDASGSPIPGSFMTIHPPLDFVGRVLRRDGVPTRGVGAELLGGLDRRVRLR